MIKKLPDGRWESRTDTYDAATGRRRQLRRRFPTKAAAQAFERQQLLEGAAPAARSVPCFADFSQEWIDNRLALGSIAPSSAVAYRVDRKALLPLLGPVLMSRLTPSRIEAALASLASTRAHSTVHRYLLIISMVCDRAVRDGLLSSNPCEHVKLPRAPKTEVHPPEASDIRALLDSLRGCATYLPVLILATTGMRVSEMMGLMWDSVDLSAGTITVRRQRRTYSSSPSGPLVPGTRTVLLDHTKTRSVRTIAIPPVLIDALVAARRDRAARGVISPFVCLSDRGLPISSGAIFNAMPDGVRVHDLRHAHATLLISAGIPVTEISRRLGHASPAVTVSVYAHAIAAQDAASAAAIMAALSPADDTNLDTSPAP